MEQHSRVDDQGSTREEQPSQRRGDAGRRGDGPRGGRGQDRDGGRGGGRGRGRPEDPNQCPIVLDRDGKLMLKVTVVIMRELAGAVIGRGGDHVQAVRSETGALVHVCKPDFNTGVQGVDLFGHLPKIHQAQNKISQVLRANAPEWSDDKEWGPRLKLLLLPDMVGTIIGKKGANVQRINKESGGVCRVSNQHDQPAGLQLVQFYGSEEEVCHAFALFLETLETYDLANSRSIEQLQQDWRAVGRGPAEPSYRGDSGGPERGSYRERGPERGRGGPDRSYRGGGGGYAGERYDPYRQPSHGRSGEDDRDRVPSRGEYGSSRGVYSGCRSEYGGGYGAPQPVVVAPQAAMPTVLIQQADGTLVQAQIVTQPAGGYSVVHPGQQQGGALAQSSLQYAAPQQVQQQYSTQQYVMPVAATGAYTQFPSTELKQELQYGQEASLQQQQGVGQSITQGVAQQGMYTVAAAAPVVASQQQPAYVISQHAPQQY